MGADVGEGTGAAVGKGVGGGEKKEGLKLKLGFELEPPHLGNANPPQTATKTTKIAINKIIQIRILIRNRFHLAHSITE